MRTIIIMLFTFCCVQAKGQKLHRDFIGEFGNTLVAGFVSENHAIDMYAVAITLSSEGKIENTSFSTGVPNTIKEAIRKKLPTARIHLKPLPEYWKKFCEENNIKTSTCLIQPVMARYEDSDNDKLSVEELAQKYINAFRFEEISGKVVTNVNVVILPVRATRLQHETIEE